MKQTRLVFKWLKNYWHDYATLGSITFFWGGGGATVESKIWFWQNEMFKKCERIDMVEQHED